MTIRRRRRSRGPGWGTGCGRPWSRCRASPAGSPSRSRARRAASRRRSGSRPVPWPTPPLWESPAISTLIECQAMSGHSKWSSIKHKKGAADAKRGKLFTKLARAITVAARDGGRRPRGQTQPWRLPCKRPATPRCRRTTSSARSTAAAGIGTDADAIEQVLFEGYGPGGAAILVEALTDNRNRTSADVRHAFTKHHGNLGEPGSVAWIFEKRGVIVVDGGRYGEDDLIVAIDAGAEDVREDGDQLRVICEPGDLAAVREALEGAGVEIEVRRRDDGAEEHGRGQGHRRRMAARNWSTPSRTTTTSTRSTPTSTCRRRSSKSSRLPSESTGVGIGVPGPASPGVPRDPDPDAHAIRKASGASPRITSHASRDGNRPGRGESGLRRGADRGQPHGCARRRSGRDLVRRADGAALGADSRRAGGADRVAPAGGGGARGPLFRQERALGDGRRSGQRRRRCWPPAQRGVRCFTYTPQAIKKAVCGSGAAGKEQVQRMVGTLLGLPEPPTPDHAADALAVAICHGGATGREAATLAAEETASQRMVTG